MKRLLICLTVVLLLGSSSAIMAGWNDDFDNYTPWKQQGLSVVSGTYTMTDLAVWKFDSSGTLTDDSSGNGYNLTNSGVVWSSDKAADAPGSGSAYFDENQTAFSTSVGVDLSSASILEVSWWCKPMETEPNSVGFIFEHGSPNLLAAPMSVGADWELIPGGARMCFMVSNGTGGLWVVGINGGNDGQWHFYKAVVDRNATNVNDFIKFYRDGQLLGTLLNDGGSNFSLPFNNGAIGDGRMYVGSRADAPNANRFKGYIDELTFRGGTAANAVSATDPIQGSAGYRETGSPDTNSLTASIYLPSSGSGGMDVGLTNGANMNSYVMFEAYNEGTWSKLWFYFSGGGGNFNVDIDTDTWYDVKIERVGTGWPIEWTGSYKKSADSAWTSLGSTVGNTQFPRDWYVPNYAMTRIGFGSAAGKVQNISVGTPALWTENFSGYTLGNMPSLMSPPWTTDGNENLVSKGYTEKAFTKADPSKEARAYRETGSPNATQLTGRMYLPPHAGTGADVGFTSATNLNDYTMFEGYNDGTSSKLYFYFAGGRVDADVLSETWYDLKLDRTWDNGWCASFKKSTDTEWIFLGSTEGLNISFVPNYVMIASGAGYEDALVDDVSVVTPPVPDMTYSDDITIDGNLNDWTDADWKPFDLVYDSAPVDIVMNESAWAAKWGAGGTKVYVVAKVRDTAHSFTNSYTEWNARDAVEMYLHTTGSDGAGYYATWQRQAQQWTIGITNSNPNAVWTAVGYPPGYWSAGIDPNYTPSSKDIKAAARVDGEWLYYEAAITPYEYFGGLSNVASVVSPLHANDHILADVVAAGNNGSYTGMVSSGHNDGGWSFDYNRLAEHNLVRTGVKGTITLQGFVASTLRAKASIVITDSLNVSETHNVVLDGSGNYTFKTTLSGACTAVASVTGFSSQSKTVVVTAGQGDVSFTLTKQATDKSIADAKNSAVGSNVGVSGSITAVFGDSIYVESSDRVSGIRVDKVENGFTGFDVGKVVDVVGTVQIDPATEETCIAAGLVGATANTNVVEPLGLTNKSAGGGDSFGQVGVDQGTGLNNIGLLVRTTGLASNGDATGFALNDGSGVTLWVFLAGVGTAYDGQYVTVTGVSSIGAGRVRVIKARSTSDVQTVIPSGS